MDDDDGDGGVLTTLTIGARWGGGGGVKSSYDASVHFVYSRERLSSAVRAVFPLVEL